MRTRVLSIAVVIALAATMVGTGWMVTSGNATAYDSATVRNTATNATASLIPATSCASGYATPWGDCLRGPWVPYPKAPTTAPDGLPYGTVGPVGNMVLDGPSTFSAGTPTVIGTSPNTTAGLNTQVNTNSYWANQTIDVGGNITIGRAGGTSYVLTLWNVVLNFTHEPTSADWSYGIFVGISGVTPTSSDLRVEHGTIITGPPGAQTPFIDNVGNGPSPVSFSESTWWFQSSKLQTVGGSGAGVSAWWWNNSEYKGGGIFGNYLLLTESPVASVFQNGTLFLYGPPGQIANSTLTGMIVKSSPGQTFSHLNVTYRVAWLVASQTPATWFNNSLFYNINLSWCPPAYSNGAGLELDANGETIGFSNVTFNRLFYDTNPTCVAFSGISGNNGNGYFGNYNFRHVMLENITSTSTVTVTFFGGGGTHAETAQTDQTVVYSRGENWHVSSGQSWPIGGFAADVNISYDVFTNISTVTAAPLYSNNVYSSYGGIATGTTCQDGNIVGGPGDPYQALPYHKGCFYYGDFFDGVTGETGAINPASLGGTVGGCTFVNIDTSSAVGISWNAGAFYYNVTGNSIFGLYNWSLGIGTAGGGGATNDAYAANSFADVDFTSQVYSSWSSSDTVSSSIVPAEIAFNENGTFADTAYSGGAYKKESGYLHHSTTLDIVGSTLSNLTLVAYNATSGAGPRSVLPNDFNITVDNSYVPSRFYTELTPGQWALGPSIGAFGRGSTWANTTPFDNPSFLNLTGYLGIYSGETYYINSSNIKSEPFLPVRLYATGDQIATVPQASGNGWLYTLDPVSAGEYVLTANSSRAPSVGLSFTALQAGYRYEIDEYASGSGSLLGASSVTASPQGTVNTTFYPAIGQLNVTFQVVAAQSFSIGGPDGSWFTTQTLFLMVFALVALTIAATWISSRREP